MYLTLGIVDLFAVILSIFLVRRTGILTTLHPAPVYWFVHVYCFTFRLFVLASGAATMPVLKGVIAQDEIVRAALLADLSLVALTAGWLWASRRKRQILDDVTVVVPTMPAESTFWFVVVMCCVSAWAHYNRGYVVGNMAPLDFASETSSYIDCMLYWGVFGLGLLHHVIGFPRLLTCLTCLVVLFTGIDSARFSLVVGTLLLYYSYASRKRMLWPSKKFLVLFATVAILFLPLKTVTQSLRKGYDTGATMDEAVNRMSRIVGVETQDGDTQFLDMAASAITLADNAGERALGRPWLQIFTLPIPRQWWPEKPRVNEFMWSIQTRDRPMGTMGMVPMLVGDAFLNFGTIGCFVVPFLVGLFTTQFYAAAMARPHASIERFAYLLFLAASIQTYRDGLFSALLFTIVVPYPLLLYLTVQLHVRRLKYRRKIFSRLGQRNVGMNLTADRLPSVRL